MPVLRTSGSCPIRRFRCRIAPGARLTLPHPQGGLQRVKRSCDIRSPARDLHAVRRVAMLAVHSNPLVEPGAGDAGGMTVYVRQLARTMAERGTQVDIFTRSGAVKGGEEPADAINLHPGVNLVQVPAGPPALSKEELASHLPEFAALTAGWASARSRTYDIIHSHYWLSGLAASALSRRWGVPFIHTFHTLGKVKNRSLRSGDVPEPEHRLRGEARVVAEADAIVASAADELEGLTELYAGRVNRIRLIAPGVDHALFRPGDKDAAKAALGLGGRKVALFVGRLLRLKGIDTAIEAVARLGGDVVLLVVGGSSGEAEGERLKRLAADLGAGGRVIFVPARPQLELPAYYRAADVCLVPSHTESFGLVALEAQASGIPVVASSVGGLREIIRHGRTGYLVEPGDVEEFVARTSALISAPGHAAAIGRAAAKSSNSYSWDRCAGAVLDLYGEVLGLSEGVGAGRRISSL